MLVCKFFGQVLWKSMKIFHEGIELDFVAARIFKFFLFMLLFSYQQTSNLIYLLLNLSLNKFSTTVRDEAFRSCCRIMCIEISVNWQQVFL